MTPDPIRVLLVEDNPGDARLIREVLSEGVGIRFDITQVPTLEDATGHLAADGRFDLILLDLSLPDARGWDTIRRAREAAPDIPIVVLSGLDDEELALQAVQAGIQDYLVKGQIEGSVLTRILRHAIERHRLSRELWERTRQLEEGERRFRALVENSSDALALVDGKGKILYARSILRVLGYGDEEYVEMDNFALVHPEDVESAQALLAKSLESPGTPIGFENRARHKDGSWRHIEGVAVNRLDDPAVGAIIANFRDVTDRKRLEDQFRQAQRLEAVGRLAGGISHDFNNLLCVIISYGELLMEALPPESPHREGIGEILKAADRAAGLTRQLLAFGRKQVLEPRVVDLNVRIGDLQKMLSRVLGEDIEVVTTLAPDLGRIRVDPGQLEQVIMNLTVNARDAMAEGGTLTIETHNVVLEAIHPQEGFPIRPGRYVMLRIQDSGTGIGPETRSHIFEPFFTTKEVGKGTGLGLATVYGIVKQNGGYIWLQSEPGQGAAFEVCFPWLDLSVEGAESAPGTVVTRISTETILLVEDEASVRGLVRKTLEASGYVVLEARDPQDGLLKAQAHQGPIDLMITDVIMPVMSGRTLADRLAHLRPTMKVLYISGYSDDVIAQHGVLETGIHFLQKPFSPELLRRKVREVLDGPGDGKA